MWRAVAVSLVVMIVIVAQSLTAAQSAPKLTRATAEKMIAAGFRKYYVPPPDTYPYWPHLEFRGFIPVGHPRSKDRLFVGKAEIEDAGRPEVTKVLTQYGFKWSRTEVDWSGVVMHDLALPARWGTYVVAVRHSEASKLVFVARATQFTIQITGISCEGVHCAVEYRLKWTGNEVNELTRGLKGFYLAPGIGVSGPAADRWYELAAIFRLYDTGWKIVDLCTPHCYNL